ncbi:MAG TPA: hypothetical protein VFF64_15990 [Candidatus Eremiobacteraceae bacterium]|nr:hypothetical protein [Candidatus Eremiobacteraceae bacterium]
MIGLILELPELAYETIGFARNRIERLRYQIILLEDRLEKAKLAAFFGWFLIVAGVAGEWYAGTKIDDLSARIQGCNDAKLVEVTEEAGSAKDSAKEARDAAKEAKDISGKAVAESSSAMTIASGARGEADSFEQDIIRLKKQMAWRSVTPECRAELEAKLKPLGGQKIDFFLLPNDPEIDFIAAQVANALEGWQVVPFQPIQGSLLGMAVEFNPNDKAASARAATLVSLLRAKPCEFVIRGPIPSLPREPKQEPAYFGMEGAKPDASIRLTIGKK